MGASVFSTSTVRTVVPGRPAAPDGLRDGSALTEDEGGANAPFVPGRATGSAPHLPLVAVLPVDPIATKHSPVAIASNVRFPTPPVSPRDAFSPTLKRARRAGVSRAGVAAPGAGRFVPPLPVRASRPPSRFLVLWLVAFLLVPGASPRDQTRMRP